MPFLPAFDTANFKICAELQLEQRETNKNTEVTHYVSGLHAAPPDWKISDVRHLASVDTAVQGNVTVGIAVGPRRGITDQLVAKADVVRAVGERVRLCQDPQTGFGLLRESHGDSRVNHIFRLHGHTMLNDEAAAKTFDEVGRRPLEMLFPGFTMDSTEQAALSAGQQGIGHKRSVDVARPAHLGALTAAELRILDMI